MTQYYLVLFDADKISEYVFATGRLKEIRGASEQVRQLTDADSILQRYGQDMDAPGFGYWHPGNAEGLIYAGGGAGALLFASQDTAHAFCQWLEGTFQRETHSATLSAVAVPVTVPDDADPATRFRVEAAAQDTAARTLAQRKASRPQATSLPGGGVIRFCSSDRLYPAIHDPTIHTPDRAHPIRMPEHISSATAIKHTSNFVQRGKRQVQQSSFWRAFETALQDRQIDVAPWRAAIRATQDMGNIGAQSQPAGYVALIHADGDRIGQVIRTLVEQHGFAGYQQVSQALSQAATEATAQALAHAYAQHTFTPQTDPETGKPHTFLPFDVITIGGDDVILICTAERGLDIACMVSQLFGERMQHKLQQHGLADEPLSASVGVVIAHDSLPIVQLQQRGKELLQSAKKASTADTGGIDFHIVTTPVLDTLAHLRQRDYTLDATNPNPVRPTGPTSKRSDAPPSDRLTCRPYRRDHTERLLAHARRLNTLLPKSKRAALYAACRGTVVQATMDVLAVHVRLESAAREALLDALHNLYSASPYPFGVTDDRPSVRQTALLDVLEAMEFVAEQEEMHATTALPAR
jgi:hypothetical protein